MKNPLIAIVIVNWNNKRDTMECLESIFATDYDRYKIIIVDNGSTDGTNTAIRKKFGEKITIITNKRNEPYSIAVNRGLMYAEELFSPDFFVTLNNDTTVHPLWLRTLMKRCKNDKTIGIIGPKIYEYYQPTVIWYAGGIADLRRGITDHVGYGKDDVGQFDIAQKTGYVTGCCLMITRKCIKKIGLMDESFRMYVEDVEYCVRAKLAGFGVWYEPNSVIYHKVSSSSNRKSPMQERLKARNTLLLLRRYSSTTAIVLFFIFQLRQVMNNVFHYPLSVTFAIWGGVIDGWRFRTNDSQKIPHLRIRA